MSSPYIFITGATAGFGEACAELFASNGFNLVITGRRHERLISLEKRLENNHGVDVITSSFDVRNEEEVNKAIDQLPF